MLAFLAGVLFVALHFSFRSQAAKASSGYANAAVFCALLSFLIVPALLAIPFGHAALRRIRAAPSLRGRGRAAFALVVGYAFLILIAGQVGLGIKDGANTFRARRIAHVNLELIARSKDTWAATNQKHAGDEPTAGDLAPFLPNHTFPTPVAGEQIKINPIGTAPEVIWPPPQY